MVHGHVALEFAGADAEKGDAVTVARVHVGLDFKDEAGEGRIFRGDDNAAHQPRLGGRGMFEKAVEQQLDAEIVNAAAEEHGRGLAGQHRAFIEGFAGDVIGLVGHDGFGIGDTLTTDPAILYKEIPRFTPEAFAHLHNPNTAKYKQFRQGLDQLLQEDVIQALYLRHTAAKIPLLAAVGPLQFEVVQFRLESEYGAESRLEAAPWKVVRWLPTDIKEETLDLLSLPTGARIAYDMGNNPVILFENEWSANYFGETNPNTPISALPVQTARE